MKFFIEKDGYGIHKRHLIKTKLSCFLGYLFFAKFETTKRKKTGLSYLNIDPVSREITSMCCASRSARVSPPSLSGSFPPLASRCEL